MQRKGDKDGEKTSGKNLEGETVATADDKMQFQAVCGRFKIQ